MHFVFALPCSDDTRHLDRNEFAWVYSGNSVFSPDKMSLNNNAGNFVNNKIGKYLVEIQVHELIRKSVKKSERKIKSCSCVSAPLQI